MGDNKHVAECAKCGRRCTWWGSSCGGEYVCPECSKSEPEKETSALDLKKIKEILADDRYGPTALANFYRADAPKMIARIEQLEKDLFESHRNLAEADGLPECDCEVCLKYVGKLEELKP